MNDALFCSIYADTAMTREATTAMVAELTGRAAANGDVDCAWARIAVDDDYGMFEIRQRDPNGFLGWKTLLEIMPLDGATREAVVTGVTSLMKGLISRGLRVLAQSAYADALPGGGEVVPSSSQ